MASFRARRTLLMLAALVLLLIAGCVADDDAAPPADGPGQAQGPLVVAPAGPEVVNLSTSKGKAAALLWDTGSARLSVVLVPGRSQPKEDWTEFAATLQVAGMRVIAVDGQGETGAPVVAAALAFLADAGPAPRAAVGASVGAGLALVAGAADDGTVGVAQLSPMPDVADPGRPQRALADLGDRPLFLATSPLDAASYVQAQQNRRLAEGDVTYREDASGAHGTELLDNDDVRRALIEWLGALAGAGPA